MDSIFVTPIDTKVKTSLAELANGRPIVIDLWKTLCPSCPAAIAELSNKAKQFPNILFVAANLDNISGAEAMAEDDDGLVHVFMDPRSKDILKASFGITRVPHCLMFTSDGRPVESGLAKLVDYGLIETLR